MNGADPDERKNRERVCALAAVELPSMEVHCVAFTRDGSAVIPADNPHPLRLQSAEFGDSDDEIIANFAWHGQWGQTERYHFDGTRWSRIQTIPGDPVTGLPLEENGGQRGPDALDVRIGIKQDLNSPPTLWASLGGKSKMLWDPNPQFATMKLGKARLYRWKDRKAYQWESVLVLPADYEPGKRYPLVIQTHGYLPAAFVTDGLYPTAMAARPLASSGIAVLQTSNRPDHFLSLQEAADAIDGWESCVAKERKAVQTRTLFRADCRLL